jgi:hypothetical protein
MPSPGNAVPRQWNAINCTMAAHAMPLRTTEMPDTTSIMAQRSPLDDIESSSIESTG